MDSPAPTVYPQPEQQEVSTFLFCAMHGDNVFVTQFLQKYPQAVDVQGAHGETALMMAAVNGSLATVKLLLEHGATPDMKDNIGHTPRMHAQSGGQTAVAKLLKPLELRAQLMKERAQFLKDTDFSKGLEKPISKPRPFKIIRGKIKP